ncbi:kinase-like domain-containing protein [Thelephora terrestris]|uniref:Kinase-like domain-containing protein n=1 Tax=Thelephora terrestris TaxID=56493 RepID=A0A9P6HL86_9AGAM|nr:kinase-like domain-containing protein [Thelephora terrestris]
MLRDYALPPPSPNYQVATLPCPRENDLPECLSSIPAQDYQRHVDALDKSIGVLTPSTFASLLALSQICKHWRMLPVQYMLCGELSIPTDPHPVASGAITDTYQSTLDGDRVYIKRARKFLEISEDSIYAEVILWKHMDHPNILPLLGVTGIPFQPVLKWVAGGNLMEYITRHPLTDRLGLLLGISEALKYLHSLNIALGSLQGSNIFVDDLGRAYLTDFSLATISPDLKPVALVRPFCPLRWTAPEILGADAVISKETDIYSFAMLMIEIYSGAAPFPKCKSTSVMVKVMCGERPERPNNPTLTDETWALIQQCSNLEPRRRPEIVEVVRCLERAIIQQGLVTDANKSIVSNSTLHSVFRLFRRSSHGPPHHQSTSFGTRGGVRNTSRGLGSWLQSLRAWQRNFRRHPTDVLPEGSPY